MAAGLLWWNIQLTARGIADFAFWEKSSAQNA